MDEEWDNHGRYTLRLAVAASCRLPIVNKTRHCYALDGVGVVHVRVTVEVCYHKFKSSIFKYISLVPAKMEMEQLPHVMDVAGDILHGKTLLDLNQQEEVSLHKRRSDSSPELNKCLQGVAAEKRAKLQNMSDNISGRATYPRDDRFVYGNPKETIKPPIPPDVFDGNNVLDLSCKGPRSDEDKTKTEGTYHDFHRNNHPYLPDAFPRSNLEIKLVNAPKRPTTTEQLQIAKLQQQQRRSVQQQQKMLQQMRRSLDSASGRPPQAVPDGQKKIVREDRMEAPKEEFHPSMMAPLFPPHPYYDPAPTKELPDGHPILPLLDPVYFSALYNAHGFMPPSSPSIAAAFISTLQDALPKLSMMFPPNSSSSSSTLLQAQKGNENPN